MSGREAVLRAAALSLPYFLLVPWPCWGPSAASMSGSAACSSGVPSLLQLPLSAQVPMLLAGGACTEGPLRTERFSPAACLSDALLCSAWQRVSIIPLCKPLCLCHCNASCLGAFVHACTSARLSAGAHSCTVGNLSCLSHRCSAGHCWQPALAGPVSAHACHQQIAVQRLPIRLVVTETLSWTLQAARLIRPGLCSAAGSPGPPAQTCPAWAIRCRPSLGRQRRAHARPDRRPYGIRDQEDDCQESWLASDGGAAVCRPSAPRHPCRHGHSAPPTVHTEGGSCSPGTLSGRTAFHLCAVWVSVTRWV